MNKENKPMPTAGFFYGTLMAPAVLRRVIFGPQASMKDSTTTRTLPEPIPAILADHQRHKVKNCDYPAVVPTKGASVRGSVVTGLTEGDWHRLDVFEGDEYVRTPVKVRVMRVSKSHDSQPKAWDALDEKELDENGEDLEVATYIWKVDEAFLEATEWDFDEFVKEKMWRWAGQHAEEEGEYKELDASDGQDSDPTQGRCVTGGHITNALQYDD